MAKRPGALGKTAIGHYLTAPELPPDQTATIAMAAVLAASGPRDVDDVRAQVRRLWLAAHDWTSVGVPIEQLDPFELEVHQAITVAGSEALPALPPYLERDHDHELRRRIARAIDESHSTMIVLIGGSSTGKTRTCWEALHAEAAGERLLAGWRLWHPFDPTRPDAALESLDNVGPRTVVWLNETQFYLLTEGRDAGERVAARLRTLLADPDRAPVLVLGTMWPEYWDTLTRRPDVGEPDPHAQARDLLVGKHIVVEESFEEGVLNGLRTSEEDPRLREAATRANNGELTQYLAGAPALLQRYETAPAGARALLTAAMDLRRLGHGLALPVNLLQAVVRAYLTDREWNAVRRNQNWFHSALTYAEQPCHGAHQPLSRIWPDAAAEEEDRLQYRLADYLEQVGRQRRRRTLVPLLLWQEVAARVETPLDAGQLGVAAADRLLYCHAIPLLRRATKVGNGYVAWKLAELLVERGDLDEAITVLRAAADTGDRYAASRLVELLVERGDLDEAITVLRAAADTGDRDAARLLVELSAERGDLDGALRAATDTGDRDAARKLADLLIERGT